MERLGFKPEWEIRKFRNDESFKKDKPYAIEKIEGNLILDEGATLLQALLIGGAGTAWDNSNSYLGVGDSNTAAAESQTGLLAATNKLYKAMEATFPSTAARVTTWKAIFGTSDANWAWEEFSLSNGSGGDSATNMNRKVSSKGTKTSGETWTLYFKLTVA